MSDITTDGVLSEYHALDDEPKRRVGLDMETLSGFGKEWFSKATSGNPGAIERLQHYVAKQSGKNGHPRESIDQLLDQFDGTSTDAPVRYVPVPTPPDALLFGTFGEWTRQATVRGEASPHAVFVSMMVYGGVCFGRKARLWIGDHRHYPVLYALHIGRSGRGRKGTAMAPTKRLHAALSVESEHPVYEGLQVAPLHHDGGVSSREGLAYTLRDRVTKLDEDGTEVVVDDGVADKRLFLIEEEFGNVLGQSGRDGNTLSEALRTCWDGGDLKPMTKNNRTYASDPHVGLVGHITPHELLTMLKDKQVNNGFLNRFFIFFAERRGPDPLPPPTPQDQIDGWARHLASAIAHIPDDAEVELDPEALSLYTSTYCGEWFDAGNDDLTAVLMERAPAMALRIAMILTLVEKSLVINADTMRCAIGWCRYWRESVEYVWRDHADRIAKEIEREEAESNGQKILAYLQRKGKPVNRSTLRNECFRGHLTAAKLDTALEHLQLKSPPPIKVKTKPKGGTNKHQNTTLIELVKP